MRLNRCAPSGPRSVTPVVRRTVGALLATRVVRAARARVPSRTEESDCPWCKRQARDEVPLNRSGSPCSTLVCRVRGVRWPPTFWASVSNSSSIARLVGMCANSHSFMCRRNLRAADAPLLYRNPGDTASVCGAPSPPPPGRTASRERGALEGARSVAPPADVVVVPCIESSVGLTGRARPMALPFNAHSSRIRRRARCRRRGTPFHLSWQCRPRDETRRRRVESRSS